MKKKELQMYLPEKKKPYLALHTNYTNYFDNLGGFEKEINTEALDFTEDDWQRAFIYLAQNTKLISSGQKVSSTVSAFRGYLKFNGFEEMGGKLKEICKGLELYEIGLSNKIDRILTREEFLEKVIYMIDEDNPRDAGILLCLFDGIRGQEDIQLRSILDKEDYFNENKIVLLMDGVQQKFSVTSETIKYLKKVNQQTTIRKVLKKTGFMFRAAGVDKTGIMPYHSINTSLAKIRDKINFTSNDASLSGIINCLLYAEYFYGPPLVENPIFLKKVQKRFRNNVKAFYDSSIIYQSYKRKNFGKDLIISDFKDEMKIIIDEINEMELTVDELAYKRGVGQKKKEDNKNGEGFEEGLRKYKIHRIKERKPALIKKAKANWLKTHQYLQCEVCGEIPFKKYGEAGNTAIEGHHEKPIKDITNKTVFYVEDIRLLCSACHSVIHHNRKKCMSITELKDLLGLNSNQNEPTK